MNDDVAPQEYANHMVEVLENLVVKVGRQLPGDQRVRGMVLLAFSEHL